VTSHSSCSAGTQVGPTWVGSFRAAAGLEPKLGQTHHSSSSLAQHTRRCDPANKPGVGSRSSGLAELVSAQGAFVSPSHRYVLPPRMLTNRLLSSLLRA